MKWLVGLALWLALCGAMSSRAVATPIYNSAPDCYFPGYANNCVITEKYYGGSIMTGTTNVYDISYGYQVNSPIIQNMANFFSSLNGSEYLNIASIYGASTQISFQGTYFENEYLGSHLSDDDLAKIVNNFTAPGSVNGGPAQSNAIYFIFTAPNVREQEDSSACGFHTDTGGLKYAWLSGFDAPYCGFGTPTQNVNAAASHELFETLTDPLVAEATSLGPPLGWYDSGPSDQEEIADPCTEEDFQTTLQGAAFTVQSIFVNNSSYAAGGFCAAGNTFSQASPAPEPQSWIFLLIGFGIVGGALRQAERGLSDHSVRGRLRHF